jgi:pimeloyl-ACP methyl ester carboxylesterase
MNKILIILILSIAACGLGAQIGGYVETNGVEFYYESYGEGKSLLMSYGFTFSGKMWEPWIEELSKRYRLIIPDKRGHGNSTNTSNEFLMERGKKVMEVWRTILWSTKIEIFT